MYGLLVGFGLMFDKGQKQSSTLSCDSSYSHSNSWATHVDLAINWVKVVTGHDLDIHCSTLAIDASLQSSWKFVKRFREKDLYGHGGHLGNVT